MDNILKRVQRVGIQLRQLERLELVVPRGAGISREIEHEAQQQLRVLATDPGSVKDFEVFARQSGHLLLESAEANGRYSYLLQKKR